MNSLLRQAVVGALGLAIFSLCITSALAQRTNSGIVAAYNFEQGAGDIVRDVSGVAGLIDLTIADPANATWGSDANGGFLTITAPTIITNPDPPMKIYDSVIPANAISVEAWVRPESATLNGAARIVNIGTDVVADAPTNRNFMLGQDNANIDARLRTTTTTNNGIPELISDPGGPVVVAPTELLHLVYTRDASGVATTYVNGVAHASLNTITGDLSNWNLDYRLALAHEFADPSADSRSWRGDYYAVAIFDRALSATEVMGNFAAGAAAPIPEPPSWLLLALGAAGVWQVTRRRPPAVS